MQELSPEARERLEQYLERLRRNLEPMPSADREHMAEDVRQRVVLLLPKSGTISAEELRRALAEVGRPSVAAEEILAEHRCSWCNRILASVEPFDAVLRNQPLSLRACSPRHREKLLRYIRFAERFMTLWFRALFASAALGLLLAVSGAALKSLPLLLAGVGAVTILPGLIFVAVPLLTARGIGLAPQRFNEVIAWLGGWRTILLARLLGALLILLGAFGIWELYHHPPW